MKKIVTEWKEITCPPVFSGDYILLFGDDKIGVEVCDATYTTDNNRWIIELDNVFHVENCILWAEIPYAF